MTNRTIKLRAWYPYPGGGGKMIPHNRISVKHYIEKGKPTQVIMLAGIRGENYDTFTLCETAIMMQYTGLKAGKTEIWEGDVLEICEGAYSVFFNEATACFDVQDDIGECESLYDMLECGDVKHLGNIYQNPTLLQRGGK